MKTENKDKKNEEEKQEARPAHFLIIGGTYCPLHTLEGMFLAKFSKKEIQKTSIFPVASEKGMLQHIKRRSSSSLQPEADFFSFTFFFLASLPFSKCFCKVTIKATVQ